MRNRYTKDDFPFTVMVGGKACQFTLSIDFVYTPAVPAGRFSPSVDATCTILDATVYDAKGKSRGPAPEWLWGIAENDEVIQSDMLAHAHRCRRESQLKEAE